MCASTWQVLTFDTICLVKYAVLLTIVWHQQNIRHMQTCFKATIFFIFDILKNQLLTLFHLPHLASFGASGGRPLGLNFLLEDADSFSVASLIKLEVPKEACMALNRELPNTPATSNI